MTKRKAPARKKVTVSAAILMSDPKYMLGWLQRKHPRTIVAKDMMDCDQCLGAEFLRSSGHPDAIWFCSFGRIAGERVVGCKAISIAIDQLCTVNHRNITAARALRALRLSKQD